MHFLARALPVADAISPLGFPQAIAESNDNDNDKAVEKSLSTKGAKAKRQGNALFLRSVWKDALKGHEPVNTSELKFTRKRKSRRQILFYHIEFPPMAPALQQI